MTPVEIITAICPDLASSPSLSVFVSLAEARTDRCFFGTNYSLAVALRACHQYTLSQRPNGESGMIGSKSEGKLSISFNAGGGNTNMGDLGQTAYGTQLADLIKSTSPAASLALTGVLGGC
jgi:hypothetical protein